MVAQLNYTIGDLEGNTQKILHTLQRARESQVEVVLFSELSICGYPPEDLLLHASFVEAVQSCLTSIVQASKGLFVVVGLVRRNERKKEKSLLNSAAVLCDGALLGFYDKILLPTYDVFDERRYFEPGTAIGLWEYKGKKIAITICEDIWQHSGYVGYTKYKRDVVEEYAKLQPDLLLNLSASPYHFQKPSARMAVCSLAAKTLQCPVVLCCQVGGNDQLVFDGYSAFVGRDGKKAIVAKGFEEQELVVDWEMPIQKEPLFVDPIEDLYHALVLGVRDYFHKSGFAKGCLGLSGGIDSSLVACIAVDALGKENVLGIAMPSRYSSEGSVSDAYALAKTLGIECRTIPIEKPFESFLDLLAPSFQGKDPDVTEENLQARIRGMILMAISNKWGYVVLSTGNKSEMAVGYCTLYGDMCGGLSVISDVTKRQVYALSRWINRDKEIIPTSCIEKPPSAELRLNQKDSDSLPDYEVLDHVLQAYVEECLSPPEIEKKYHLPIELVIDIIKKIHRAEYKRRQAAPGIRVSTKAFRVGRRYPIVQGWY